VITLGWRSGGGTRYLLARLLVGLSMPLAASGVWAEAGVERLLAAYPDHLAAVDGNDLVWKDGTRMAIDDGRGPKPFAQWLASPDLKGMFAIPYPPGDLSAPPAKDSDPGRARNHAFFARMYGDCTKGEVVANLVDVVWLPKKAGQKLKVSKVNGVAERLAAVSRALDDLPASFDVYLKPSAGTYVCRPIAGTGQISAHGYGIAIDIAVGTADYWRWSKGGAAAYRNRIPPEIVRIFEAQGFIWGGKWSHYDTMHFEYRPELSDKS
jgi:D-alanyl-D-alanine carboxypeptidase